MEINEIKEIVGNEYDIHQGTGIYKDWVTIVYFIDLDFNYGGTLPLGFLSQPKWAKRIAKVLKELAIENGIKSHNDTTT